jgi:hypothetical protein
MAKIRIIDDRLSPRVRLIFVEFGDTFYWNDYLCMRIDPAGVDITPKDGKCLCLAVGSGQLVEIDRDAEVTPCKCELTVEE